MALELKIESLRARGELTASERDRLIHSLQQTPQPSKKPAFFTPRRWFLVGAVCGIGIAYLTWSLFS